MKTYIPGKDAALEDSIDYFHKQLAHHHLEAEEASWLNPVPNVWSVHIQNTNCPLCFTNGKGASKKAAYASSLGEYFERLSTHYFFSDFYLGDSRSNGEFVHYPNEKWFSITDDDQLPDGLLTKALWDFYNPNDELQGSDLIDLQSSNQQRGICGLPFTSQRTNETVYIPVNLIANLYASNGMSAGNTKNEARVQALSEIFERYVKNKILTENLSLPEIPEEILAQYPTTVEAIKKLEQEGFSISCFDASLGGKYPVICVILFNQKNNTCYASFGSHPNFGVALERTVTELLQGRSLNDLDVFSPPSFDVDDVADLSNIETHFIDSSGLISWDLFNQTNSHEFHHWNFSGSTDNEFNALLNIMLQQALDVLIMDYDHLGVYACRIIATGMSEIYPPEDLLLANNAMAIHWRDTILSLPSSNLTSDHYLVLIEQLDDEGIDDSARVRELLGLATGKDNAWHTLRVGELKAMLALAAQDLEQAIMWIEWTIDMNESIFSNERNQFYRCLYTIVNFYLERSNDDFEDYRPAFDRMYGDELVTNVYQVVSGDIKFYGLFNVDNELSQFPMHQKLLAVYDILHNALEKQPK